MITTYGDQAGPAGGSPWWYTNVPEGDPSQAWVRWTFTHPVTSLKLSVTGMEGPDAATGDPEHYTVSDGSTVFADLGSTGTLGGSNPVTWSGSTASCEFTGCQGYAEVTFSSGITWIEARGSSNPTAGWNGVGVALPSEQTAPPVTLDAVDDSGVGVKDVSADYQVRSNDVVAGTSDPAPVTSVVTLASGGTASGVASAADGVVSYTPTAGEAGSTVTQRYRLCPAGGATTSPPCDTATLSIAVAPPAPPVAPALTSSGVGTAEQQSADVRPTGGALSLLDAGAPVTHLDTDQGSYDVYGDALFFHPREGFSGTFPAVSYEITDVYGQTASSTYTTTVTKPAGPVAHDVVTTGPRASVQRTDPTAGTGNPAADLLGAGGQLVTQLVVSGKGTYRASSGDGVELSFTPLACFVGAVPPVTFRLTDSYDQSDEATYTATVTNPPVPTAAPVSSTGIGTAAQTLTLNPPSCGGTVHLINGVGTAVTTLVRPGEGTYTVVPATGEVTFTPDLGFAGTATPVTYRLTDAQAQTASSTYTPTVTAPAGPEPADLTSTGVGTAPQIVTPSLPPGGLVVLLQGVTPVTQIAIDGQGSFAVDSAGALRFTPVLGYTGTPAPVVYRVTDAYGQTGTASYTPTVTAPTAPVAPALTSTGVGTARQSASATVPTGGSITLLDAGAPVTTLAVPGQGTYSVNSTTGALTFTPVIGYTGTPTVASYRVTDAYAQSADATYTPTVTIPPAPTAPPGTSTGASDSSQSHTVVVPPGGSITLLSGTVPVTTLTIPDQGTYTLDTVTGRITFTALAGFSGRATPATYRVTDAYGQTAIGSYTPTVTPVPPATTPVTPVTPASPGTKARTKATEALPRTGADLFPLMSLAFTLLLLGAAAIAASRSRRRA